MSEGRKTTWSKGEQNDYWLSQVARRIISTVRGWEPLPTGVDLETAVKSWILEWEKERG